MPHDTENKFTKVSKCFLNEFEKVFIRKISRKNSKKTADKWKKKQTNPNDLSKKLA